MGIRKIHCSGVTKLIDQTEAIRELKEAFAKRDLTLYLGAGVSMPSGLPSWEQLVLLMYFRTLYADLHVRAFSNHLMAIAEWLLRKRNEPLDVVIRKIRHSGWSEQDFMTILWESLYSNLLDGDDPGYIPPNLLGINRTLDSVVQLCSASIPDTKGVRSIITYNYDNLLQLGLRERNQSKKFQTVYETGALPAEEAIPIYHVHGFVPLNRQEPGSAMQGLVFSEDQYNAIYQDSYFWGNMVQMQNMAGNTGLMIGISLADRNVRRLLDAVRRAPLRTRNYLLLRRPSWSEPAEGSEDMKFIREKALELKGKIEGSGVKKQMHEYDDVKAIVQNIAMFENSTFAKIYEDMGLTVLLYDDHSEIPEFLKLLAAS
jgi:hypothetical protein